MTLWTTARRGWDGASNEGCNSGPTGHDFTDNSINLSSICSPFQHGLLNDTLHCSLVKLRLPDIVFDTDECYVEYVTSSL